MNCYKTSFDEYKNKELINERYNYLKDFNCCDEKSCDDFAFDLEKTKNMCNDTYGHLHKTNDKGNIIKNTICNEIDALYYSTLNKANKMAKNIYNTTNKTVTYPRIMNSYKKSSSALPKDFKPTSILKKSNISSIVDKYHSPSYSNKISYYKGGKKKKTKKYYSTNRKKKTKTKRIKK